MKRKVLAGRERGALWAAAARNARLPYAEPFTTLVAVISAKSRVKSALSAAPFAKMRAAVRWLGLHSSG